MEKLLKEINKNPQKLIKKVSVNQLEKILKFASDRYYNDDPVLDDDVYDLLEEKLRQMNPKSKLLNDTGAPVRGDIQKIRLPVWMGSLDKIKPGKRETDLWFERYTGPYMISEKLDGISGLIVYSDGGVKIYTRGDGEFGQDISFLESYLDLPKVKEDICVRGEFVLKNSLFDSKYSSKFPKPRTVVSSLVNSKRPDQEILGDIDFLVYEIVKEEGVKWSSQFDRARKLGFKIPEHVIVKNTNQVEMTKLLTLMKESSLYEIDGLVISQDDGYLRYTSGRPKYSVAFKVDEPGVRTSVLDVLWEPSKFGILKPRVQIEPVVIEGDTINFTTGKNAKFIRQQGIGKGTILRVTKSGGVIPEITKVLEKKTPKFPGGTDYEWNETEVEIVLKNWMSSEEVKIKRLLHIFQVLGVPNISIGNVTKMFNSGFNTVKKIYQMEVEDFLKIPTFKDKTSEKLYESVQTAFGSPIPLEVLMTMSLVFGNGFAEKKFSIIVQKYKTIEKISKLSVSEISLLEGFSDKSAEQFESGMDKFLKFMEVNSFFRIKETKSQKKGSHTGMNVVFTGFRDNNLKDQIESRGGKVLDSVNAKTTLLLYKADSDLEKGKGVKAKKLGIKTLKRDDFHF
jgi:DNA ligase (NAD+)